MFYKNLYRYKSSGNMDKDPFSWNQRIPITGFLLMWSFNLELVGKDKSQWGQDTLFSACLLCLCADNWYFVPTKGHKWHKKVSAAWFFFLWKYSRLSFLVTKSQTSQWASSSFEWTIRMCIFILCPLGNDFPQTVQHLQLDASGILHSFFDILELACTSKTILWSIKQERKRPLDTPKRMIERREREGKRERKVEGEI